MHVRPCDPSSYNQCVAGPVDTQLRRALMPQYGVTPRTLDRHAHGGNVYERGLNNVHWQDLLEEAGGEAWGVLVDDAVLLQLEAARHPYRNDHKVPPSCRCEGGATLRGPRRTRRPSYVYNNTLALTLATMLDAVSGCLEHPACLGNIQNVLRMNPARLAH